mgnify:CR=1 FL=1
MRVAPELVSSGLGTDVRASMLDDLQRAWDAFGASGDFRITQTTVRISAERALRLIEEIAERVRDEETDDAQPLVVTAFMHPVRTGSTDQTRREAAPIPSSNDESQVGEQRRGELGGEPSSGGQALEDEHSVRNGNVFEVLVPLLEGLRALPRRPGCSRPRRGLRGTRARRRPRLGSRRAFDRVGVDTRVRVVAEHEARRVAAA